MTREEFYIQIPRLTKRLFTWGLVSAVLFLVIWYSGGINAWGYFITFLLKPFSWLVDVSYAPGSFDNALFVYAFPTGDGRVSELTLIANGLNSSLVVMVTLLATWPSKDAGTFFRLLGWCLVFALLYHFFHLFIQLYSVRIGPDFANRQRIFWEESTWYVMVKHVAAFDKFILRYWGGFPIFLAGLAAASWWRGMKNKPDAKGRRK